MRFSNSILAAAVLLGCRGAAGGATPEECAPPTAELTASSSAAGLAGEYQLRLVATSGAKTGATVQGTLTLQPQGQDLLYRTTPGGTPDTTWSHPLYGSAELDLAAVDAVEVGSTMSMDPMKPGVLVMERNPAAGQAAPTEVVIRLGAEANRRDRQRFDGGYTALRIRETSPERFRGTWSSGVRMERAGGYFCAVRKGGKDGKDG